jgi:hypothetical protein
MHFPTPYSPIYGSDEDSNLVASSSEGITVDLRPETGKDRQTGLRALPLSYTARCCKQLANRSIYKSFNRDADKELLRDRVR